MQTIEKSLPSDQPTADAEFVEAVIISGPQKGRIVQLRGEELENALSPAEKKALEEMFDIQNEYWAKRGEPGIYEETMRKMDELKEKYRGLV